MCMIIFILYLQLLSVCDAISACVSPIHMSNGVTKNFHADTEEYIEKAALTFCEEHVITYDDCQRIVDYHRSNCFSTESSDNNHEQIESDNTKDQYEKVESISDDGRIDYSQTIGPQLLVNYEYTKRIMQMYKGESPSQAVSRFCMMLKLDEPQCTNVRNVFFNRCLDAGIIHDDLLDTEDLPPAGTGTSSSERDSSLWENISSKFNGYLHDYWNWVALLIVIVYVILHHN